MTINHIPELSDKEFRWLLQRLFPYPEDIGPFEYDRYKVFIGTYPNSVVAIHPMPAPSSEIIYRDFKYEKV
jgi:hypothetical protein